MSETLFSGYIQTYPEAYSNRLRLAVTEQLNATLCKPQLFHPAAVLYPELFDELYAARHLLHHNLATVYRKNEVQQHYMQFRELLDENAAGLSLADYVRCTLLKGLPFAFAEDTFPSDLPEDTESTVFWHEPEVDWGVITGQLAAFFEERGLAPEDFVLFTRPYSKSPQERIQGVHGSIEQLPHIHIWTRKLQAVA